MNFTKIKKVLSAGVAAVMCVTMAFSVPAAAKTDNTAYNNAKALSSAKYSSANIKLAEKYAAKKATKTVTFSKSKTKKYYESQAKALEAKNPQFSIDLINSDTIISMAMKNKKLKVVMYMKEGKEELGLGMYFDKKNMTIISPIKKMKITVPIPEDTDYDSLIDESFGNLDNDAYMAEDLGIADNAKGKYFKFTSNDKTYYYEEFDSDKGTIGFLFNSSGKPIVMNNDGTFLSMNYSTKVDDSAVTVPKSYKEAGEDDMEDFFGNVQL